MVVVGEWRRRFEEDGEAVVDYESIDWRGQQKDALNVKVDHVEDVSQLVSQRLVRIIHIIFVENNEEGVDWGDSDESPWKALEPIAEFLLDFFLL